MFVVTMKWNKKVAVLIIIAAALILGGIILAISLGGSGGSDTHAKAKTNDDRLEFLDGLGWEVEANPIAEKTVIIPKEFSPVYDAYNKLQISQGYDLSEYCGLEAKIYTYSIVNYSGYTGKVVADLYVRNGEIIGGDVHSLALDGFMHGLKMLEE
ncbi:MAG: DUF4830 domain-containing protein [Oscillospiraceae bacterium]